MSVVSHGHGELLTALLDDLMAAVGPSDQVIVTFNIPEASALKRECWPEVEWIDNSVARGFGANHNRALLGRNADWYAIVNPDIRLQPDAIARLIENVGDDRRVAVISPIIVDADGEVQDSVRALLTPVEFLSRVRARLAAARGKAGAASDRLDWLAGMFLIVRSGAFTTLRGFDERFFLYCEDMDLSIRMQLAGFHIRYDSGVTVVHDARRDSHTSARHLRFHLASLLRVWASLAFWRYMLHRSRYAALKVGPPRDPATAAGVR